VPAQRPRSRTRLGLVALVSGLITALVTIVWINLLSGEHRPEKPFPALHSVHDPQFAREANALFGPALIGGNQVTSLYNGRQIFSAMLEAIRSARMTITFETYIYWSGHVGSEFSAALSDRARAGVKVHLVLDAVGSGNLDAGQIQQMRDAGVEVEKYHPLRWYNLDRINNRTHRKLLIVDGRVGFTGGVGIADKWDGDADGPEHWRDSHFRVVGPVVAQMQATFIEHWLATRGVLLDGPAYFPALEPAGDMPAQMVRSAVDDGTESVRLMYLASIASARRSILLANSYFVPDELAIRALIDARTRGVDVEIIVPGSHSDSGVTRAASRRLWGRLLEAGIPIYEFSPTMFHCKVMVVDEQWVSVGSTNFDNRSFHLNAEANLNVLSTALAREERLAFERDRARSHRISLADWQQRKWSDRAGDWLAGLIGSQL
jgi:cardiolipin synthase A/B